MGTRWKCDQCGKTTHTGMIESLQGGPEACEHCGNEDFNKIETTGVIHSTLEDLQRRSKKLPFVGD